MKTLNKKTLIAQVTLTVTLIANQKAKVNQTAQATLSVTLIVALIVNLIVALIVALIVNLLVALIVNLLVTQIANRTTLAYPIAALNQVSLKIKVLTKIKASKVST